MKRKFTFQFLVSMLAIFSLTSSIVFGQGSVSYSPQTYYEVNQPIPTLSPGGTLSIDGGNYGEVSLFANGASFDNPRGIVKDAVGNYYIAEIDGKRITKVTSSGVVSIVKQFTSFVPRDLAINTENGDLFCVIADHRILWIKNSNTNYPNEAPVYNWINDPTHVIAGSTDAGFKDGSGTESRFNNPWGLAMGHDNTYLVVADFGNNCIRKVYLNYDQNENISISNTRVFTHMGYLGADGGVTDVHVVSESEWILSNWSNDYVMKRMKTSTAYLPYNGVASTTMLNHPNWSISNYDVIYAFIVTGSTTAGPVYGNQNDWYGHNSNIAAAAVHAGILKPGETDTVYIRSIVPNTSMYGPGYFPPNSAAGTTSNGVTSINRNNYTTYPLNSNLYYQLFRFSCEVHGLSQNLITGSSFNSGNFDGSTTTAYTDQPHQVTTDGLGNIYVVESYNHKVRKINNLQYLNYTWSAKVSTIAGSLWDNSYSGNVPSTSISNGTNARFSSPSGLYFDAEGGFLLVADSGNDRIKKIQIEGFEVIPAVAAGLNFNASNGQLTGTPTETTLASQYINTFNGSSLGSTAGGAATVSGNAAQVGDYVQLVPRKNSQFGGFTIPATGVNHNALQVSFRVLSTKNSAYGGSTTSQAADGFSYSFSSDASATATAPTAELGSGSHLSISFASYSGNRGIRVYYNPSNVTSFSQTINSVLLAYSNNVSWMGNQTEVVIRVNEAGQLTLTLNGTAVFTNIQLPAAYLNANKSDWKHVFKARTGGSDDIYAIDNLAILQGPGTTNHLIVARENNYYEELVVPVNVTIQGPTVAASQTLCSGSTVADLVATTNISGATIAWYTSATGGSALSSSTLLSSGTYYASQISGTQESGREPVSVSIQSLGSVSGSASVCTGSSANLTAINTTGDFQWQVSIDGGISYSDILGETSSSYTSTALSSATSYRVMYTSGVCSGESSASLAVGIDQASVAGTISGSSSVCSGSTASLNLTGSTGTIVWTNSSALAGPYTSLGVATANLATSAINATTYFRAQVTNGACPAALSAVHTVGVSTIGTISSITGPSSVTPGGVPVTYEVAAVSNATSYVWNMPAGLTITTPSNNGRTVQVEVSNSFVGGVVSVYAQGCTNSATQTKTVNAPGQTGMSITGTAVVCGSTNGVSYSVPTVSGASYQWSLPVGLSYASGFTGTESSIQVNFASGYVGGYISCVRSTTTTTNTASISVGAMTTPGVITQSTALCGATSTTYSIAAVSGATSYQWQLPTGMTGSSTTTSITAAFSGSVSGSVQVRAVGACGTSAWRSLAVASTPTPSTITGPSMLCGAATYTITGSTMTQVSQTTLNYSVTNVAGTTYAWTVPSGMTITSGQGTNAIVASVDLSTFTSGSVSVIATVNSCQSAPRTLTVSKSVATITGPAGVCGLTTATYSVPAGSGSSYTWTLPSWMTPSTGYTLTSNPIQVDIAATGTSAQSISVEIETSCGDVTVSTTVGCGLYSQLENTYCGGSVSNATQVVLAQYIGSGSYKFEVSGGSIGSTASILTQSWNGFTFAQIPGILPGTYSVKVSFKPTGSGTFGSFGSTCSVTLGSDVPSTEVISSQCGSTVSTLTTVVSATYKGAGTYQFVISGNGLGSPVTLTQSWNGFTFAQIPGVLPGSYNVKVNYKPTGYSTYGPDGQVCSVTLGSDVPSTEVISSQCGSTVSTLTTVVSATYKGAGTYQFVISGNGLGSPVTLTQSWNGFTFAQIPGVLPGSYNVKVNYKPTGYSTYGPDGQVCSVTLGSDVPSTEVISSQCGSTVSTLTTVVSATYKGAGTYQFVISGNGLGSPVTLTQSWNGFTFAQIPGVLPGSYNVKVNYKPTGYSTYGPDGQVCSVTLGSDVPSTEVISSQCGSTVSTLTTVVSATYKGAGTYQFVISGNGLGSPVTLTQSWNGFTFAQIPGILPGSYNVKVNYKPTGYSTYGPDGQVCSVTLGSDVPSTEIEACGSSGINGMSTIVFATYKGAGTYEFVINHASFTSPVTLTQSWNGFMFSQVPGAIYGQYSITVRYKPTGYSSFGQPTTCNSLELLDPGALVIQDPQLHEEATEGIQTEEDATETTASLTETPATTTWTATATSNPFEHSFKVNLNEAEAIEIAALFTATLTDMSGKVYSQATLSKEQLEAESFGEQLAPGMYLMTLRQGEDLRVIRVVKR